MKGCNTKVYTSHDRWDNRAQTSHWVIVGIGTPGEKGQKGEPGGPVRFSRHVGKTDVGFSVSRSNKLGPVTEDTPVMFDRVYSNVGRG